MMRQKLVTLFLGVWVLYHTYNDHEFAKKLNSLDYNTARNAQIQFSTHSRPHYMVYWTNEVDKS